MQGKFGTEEIILFYSKICVNIMEENSTAAETYLVEKFLQFVEHLSELQYFYLRKISSRILQKFMEML